MTKFNPFEYSVKMCNELDKSSSSELVDGLVNVIHAEE